MPLSGQPPRLAIQRHPGPDAHSAALSLIGYIVIFPLGCVGRHSKHSNLLEHLRLLGLLCGRAVLLPDLFARTYLFLPLAQLVALLDPEPVPEHQLDLFEAQPRGFREAREDEDPAEEAEARVEPEGTRGGDLRHEREVGRADEQIAGPVRRGRQRCADPADCRAKHAVVRCSYWCNTERKARTFEGE